MTPNRNIALSGKARRQAAMWLAASLATAPDEVQACLADVLEQLTTESLPREQFNTHWRQLGRALGILPSSERRRSSRPSKKRGISEAGAAQIGSEDPEQEQKRLQAAAARSRRLSREHAARARKYQARLKQMNRENKSETDASVSNGQEELNKIIATPVEEFELSAEEEAESEKEAEEFVARAMLGDGPDPALQSEREALMDGHVVTTHEDTAYIEAELPEGLGEDNVERTFTKKSIRYDFAMSVTRFELEVEKKLVKTRDGTRKIIAASTREYGPSRFSVTWGALATLACMIGQFALPMNRLATMLSTPWRTFTASCLSRMAHYVAARVVPIYIECSHQLADAAMLSGDDTSCRVVEVASHFKASPTGAQQHREPPWRSYANPEAAEASYEEVIKKRQALLTARANGDRDAKRQKLEEPSLSIQIGRELTFESPRRDGKGQKRSLNTTLVTGRSIEDDPSSLVVLYRSHLGSFGDLTEMLLQRRRGRLKKVLIQGDLSSTNLVTDENLLQRFDIQFAGCSSHARRPFALYEDADPIYGPFMLDQFRQLSFHERTLDQVGRNRINVQAVRENDSKSVWVSIKEIAETVKQRWSRATPLGTAARYILKHFEKLTAYLRDPRLAPTNNLRERLLRTEKLIEKGSMFRRTIEGRAVLDILRTILQTSVAAGVPTHEYLVDILKTDPAEISAYPERYTPHAWKQRQRDAEMAGQDTVD